jgi:probable phosphoglycerate mutase
MDIPLNKTGRAQARLASIRLVAVCATALYSSDLLRAYETAQIIGQATGLQVVQKPGLREINFGVWQGLSSPQIRERAPDVYAARRANPYDVAPAGAETWRYFCRASELCDILAATEAQRVIVVTHSGVCTAWLRALCLIAPASDVRFP